IRVEPQRDGVPIVLVADLPEHVTLHFEIKPPYFDLDARKSLRHKLTDLIQHRRAICHPHQSIDWDWRPTHEVVVKDQPAPTGLQVQERSLQAERDRRKAYRNNFANILQYVCG